MPSGQSYQGTLYSNVISLQRLPLDQRDRVDESSGTWETVYIPVTDPTSAFAASAAYTLKNLHPGACRLFAVIASSLTA